MRAVISTGRRRAPVAFVLLVPLIALGASARAQLSAHAPHDVAVMPALIATATALVVAVLWLAMTMTRGARFRRRPDLLPTFRPPPAGAHANLVGLLGAVVVVAGTLVALGFGLRLFHPATTSGGRGSDEVPSAPDTVHHGVHNSLTYSPGEVGILVAVAIVLIVAAFLYARYRRHYASTEDKNASQPLAMPSSDVLAAAIRKGAQALGSTDDVRRAICQSYAAMRAELLLAGVPHTATQTARELLALALDGHAAPYGAAEELTMLFERARFSSEDLSNQDRAAARAAFAAFANARR